MNISLKTKHTITKIFSYTLLIQGVYILVVTIFAIFKYTNQISSGNIEHTLFQESLKLFVVEGITALAETSFGLILLTTKSTKLNIFHYIIGAALFLLPFFLNNQVLTNIESNIPQVMSPVSKVYAQTSPQQSLNDLQFQLQQYRNAHQQYLSAKNSYISFNTLNSKQEATIKTKILLSKRAQALKSYIFALRVNLINLPQDKHPLDLITQLEDQEEFLTSHLEQIDSISTTEQITSISDNLQTQYPQIQILAYKSLLNLVQSQLTIQKESLNTQHQILHDLLPQDENNELNADQINLWLTDFEKSIVQSPQSQEKIDKNIDKLRTTQSSLISNQRNFSNILNVLSDTRTQLIKNLGFLQEIIKLFKYG